MEKITFEDGGKKYAIPLNLVSKFMEKHPNAKMVQAAAPAAPAASAVPAAPAEQKPSLAERLYSRGQASYEEAGKLFDPQLLKDMAAGFLKFTSMGATDEAAKIAAELGALTGKSAQEIAGVLTGVLPIPSDLAEFGAEAQKEQLAKEEEAYQRNPKAYVAGAAMGSIPSGVFGAGKTLAARAATGIPAGMAGGYLMSEKQGAEAIPEAIAGGVGGLAGAALPNVANAAMQSRAAQGVRNYAQKTLEKLGENADINRVLTLTSATGRQIGKEKATEMAKQVPGGVSEMARVLRETGISKGVTRPGGILKRAGDVEEQANSLISEVIASTDQGAKDALDASEAMRQQAMDLLALHGGLQKNMPRAVKAEYKGLLSQADEYAQQAEKSMISGKEASSHLRDAAREIEQQAKGYQYLSPENKTIVDNLIDAATRAESRGSLTMREAQNLINPPRGSQSVGLAETARFERRALDLPTKARSKAAAAEVGALRGGMDTAADVALTGNLPQALAESPLSRTIAPAGAEPTGREAYKSARRASQVAGLAVDLGEEAAPKGVKRLPVSMAATGLGQLAEQTVPKSGIPVAAAFQTLMPSMSSLKATGPNGDGRSPRSRPCLPQHPRPQRVR
jgi:hypothetical protein